MRQHTLEGRGAPTFPPGAVNQQYVDLDTREVYISTGNQYVSDWGTPFIRREDLSSVIDEMIASVTEGGDVDIPLDLPAFVDTEDNVKKIYLDVPTVLGRFVRLTDPTEAPGPVKLIVRLEYGYTLRPGMRVSLYNSTGRELSVESTNQHDYIEFSGSRAVAPTVQIAGFVHLRYLGSRGAGGHYAISGDTNKSMAGTVEAAINSSLLQGMSVAQILAAAHAAGVENADKLGGLPAQDYVTHNHLSDAFEALTDAFTATANNIVNGGDV